MKPSESILKLFDKKQEYFPNNILEYLDEQAGKEKTPKICWEQCSSRALLDKIQTGLLFACPNCHRIVNELIIESNYLGNFLKYKCKHCAEK
jgi:hypothetical protein